MQMSRTFYLFCNKTQQFIHVRVIQMLHDKLNCKKWNKNEYHFSSNIFQTRLNIVTRFEVNIILAFIGLAALFSWTKMKPKWGVCIFSRTLLSLISYSQITYCLVAVYFQQHEVLSPVHLI